MAKKKKVTPIPAAAKPVVIPDPEMINVAFGKMPLLDFINAVRESAKPLSFKN